ncbi:MAG: glycosyltransferase, partial [Candidatus Woesebacteria bacterium]|nr:glycosyltransferase [Candidatus Woesebacteria bacterium]
MEPRKLLLAGSHGATTGLAIIEEIKSKNLDWEVFWVGRKHAGERNKSHSLEFKILPKLGVIFYHLESGKIENKFTRYTIPALIKIPFGFLQALALLLKIRPDLTLSLGGASGSLVSFWSWVLGIPIIVHEQTASAGRANIFSSKFAKKIAISREASQKYFPKDKVVLTGNPISKNIINIINKPKNSEVKTILITGGSRGSTWLNNAVRPILDDLLKKYFVIHQ